MKKNMELDKLALVAKRDEMNEASASASVVREGSLSLVAEHWRSVYYVKPKQ
jgi:sulfur relay (sulfurtransferase) DsrC/TusE family protein